MGQNDDQMGGFGQPGGRTGWIRTRKGHSEMQGIPGQAAPGGGREGPGGGGFGGPGGGGDLAGEEEAVAAAAAQRRALSAGLRESTRLWARSACCASASTACTTVSTIRLEIQR